MPTNKLLQDVSHILQKLVHAKRVCIASLSVTGISIESFSGDPLKLPLQELYEQNQIAPSRNSSFHILHSHDRTLGFLYIEKSENSPNETPILHDFIDHIINILEYSNHLIFQTEELQKTKYSRDGDYFLISLLLDSLQINYNYIPNIKTDYLIFQKKQFYFNKRNGEIGGDLCQTDTIYLNDGHQYTVFINGDAMGKSVQGAGGAIVLGVVFDAALSRAKQRKNKNYNTYPEHWLKEVFLDLHYVFESFQGNMFSSFILGLVHPETKTLYYINAEHPSSIIYRDKVATFLETEPHLNKLGFPEQDKNLSIRLFKLLDKDIIIMGSDGKDDLIIGYDEKGNFDIINNDENMILKCVQEADADLKKIYELLSKNGKFKDDLSLLKIEFKDKYKKVKISEDIETSLLNIYNILRERMQKTDYNTILSHFYSLKLYIDKVPSLSKLLAKIYYNEFDLEKSVEFFEKYSESYPSDNLYIVPEIYIQFLEILCDYYIAILETDKAIECLEEYIYIEPSNNKMLFKLSKSYLSLNKLLKAHDTAVRLILREPENFDYLIHISDIFLKLKYTEEAQESIQKAKKINPKDPIVLKILKELKNL